jgi:hypothetical protein
MQSLWSNNNNNVRRDDLQLSEWHEVGINETRVKSDANQKVPVTVEVTPFEVLVTLHKSPDVTRASAVPAH